MQTVKTDLAPQAIGPYSQAVVTGNTIYASGQIGLRPDGSLVTGSIEDEVLQVLENVDAILTAAGVSRASVVKTTIFMTDLANFEKVNQVYGNFFGDHRPARSTVQVAALPKGAQVEIEVMAVS
ncbi:RidA family protein [Alicyclobacillus sp. SO9]|uniref:RidA family protein n=1 Tax=Alicyclobacillus sp. SO9 TaxID=2665646 RepID=UPI0018E79978|nr:RidA family protein [Alicyclobacillus sp. SO9]QQE79402.1 RidA family protein [Alicyclobacillus sp. SO9]